MNKKKIINDPVYGFISIRSELVFDIIDHPYFQRLRRIKQMGLTDLVYPGAHHTRFHHAIGAMHLMSGALDNLIQKGVDIAPSTYEAALIAILLHDIGHGPFSHALEFSLLKNVQHEYLSRIIIQKLNEEFDGALDEALAIFENKHPQHFLHQLVSSQLDIDRLDYLKRDSFFTGVSEGTIGADRIIKMLDVKDNKLVVEEKGIYSIENFLSARRLMYWQVYLHKTGVSAEKMLIAIINRARYLVRSGSGLLMSEALSVFFQKKWQAEDFKENPQVLASFLAIDDFDIWGAIKLWENNPDTILSKLCLMLFRRELFKITVSTTPFTKEDKHKVRQSVMEQYGLSKKEADYFYSSGQLTNSAYLATDQKIMILSKEGDVQDVMEAADLPNIKAMSKMVRKYYQCWPKDINLQ